MILVGADSSAAQDFLAHTRDEYGHDNDGGANDDSSIAMFDQLLYNNMREQSDTKSLSGEAARVLGERRCLVLKAMIHEQIICYIQRKR